MKVVVGLGNPGEKYEDTRHNIGFLVIDELKNQISKIKSQNENFEFKLDHKFEAEICKMDNILLVKPQTFMNDSGRAVYKVLRFYTKYKIQNTKYDDLYIIHDDLDILEGDYKIQFAKGPKIHNGVNSVENVLKTKDFWRVRFGVDGRSVGQRDIPGKEYVLKTLSLQEKTQFNNAIKNVVKELLETI